MQVGDFNLWIQHSPQALLAGVVRGTAPKELKSVFQEALERICQEHVAALDGFDGDTRPFQSTGPYLDADGRAMLEGGGTLVLEGNERWRGPGHNSVLTTEEGQWMVHHTYDVQNQWAQRVLQIRTMWWSPEGWPKVGEPIFEPKARASTSVLKRE